MTDLPSFTIVTPSLNAAGTIEKTLESVAAQDYPASLIEHIVIDGGSTDGTVAILERAGVRFVSEPDRGLSDALNKGLSGAGGAIFGELNADDCYRPGALRAVAEAFAANPDAAWVTGLCPIVGASGREIRQPITRYKNFFVRRWRFRLHLLQNFVSAPATFVRTDALRQVGGFDTSLQYAMDYDVWLRLGRLGPPIVLDRPLATFRMAGESLSLTGFERQFEEHAAIASRHGSEHPWCIRANHLISGAIVTVYRVMRAARRRG